MADWYAAYQLFALTTLSAAVLVLGLVWATAAWKRGERLSAMLVYFVAPQPAISFAVFAARHL